MKWVVLISLLAMYILLKAAVLQMLKKIKNEKIK